MTNFWQDLGVLNVIQFGFLEGKSTVTQLLTCYDDWASSRNKSKPTDIVFLDFTKAFDSLPHERLLLKLKGYGIEGNLLHWFRNFLTNRQQRVVVRGLFMVLSDVEFFADGTKVYREISNSINDTRVLQTDIDHLANWATLWQLRFNPEKCETMRITYNRDLGVFDFL